MPTVSLPTSLVILRIYFFVNPQEVEPFLTKCHACGRRLVSVMSEIKSTEGVSLSRRQLYQQQRQLTRVLNDVELLRLRKDGPTILAQIEDRVQWLPNSYDVR